MESRCTHSPSGNLKTHPSLGEDPGNAKVDNQKNLKLLCVGRRGVGVLYAHVCSYSMNLHVCRVCFHVCACWPEVDIRSLP